MIFLSKVETDFRIEVMGLTWKITIVEFFVIPNSISSELD